MTNTDQAVPSTSRLNFGDGAKPVSDTTPQTTDANVQAVEAQQEAVAETPVSDKAEASTEPTTETAAPVDASEAPATDAPSHTPTPEDTPVPVGTSEVTEETVAAGEAATAPEIKIENPADGGKSVEELNAEREKIENELAQRKATEKESVLNQIKTVATTYGITINDIVESFGGYKQKRASSKAKPKYKDPATGALWSGRGRAPLWIKDKDYKSFLIEQPAG